MEQISQKGELNYIEKLKSARDAAVNVLSTIVAVGTAAALSAIATYVTGEPFVDSMSQYGLIGGLITQVAASTLAPALNRKSNIMRIDGTE